MVKIEIMKERNPGPLHGQLVNFAVIGIVTEMVERDSPVLSGSHSRLRGEPRYDLLVDRLSAQAQDSDIAATLEMGQQVPAVVRDAGMNRRKWRQIVDSHRQAVSARALWRHDRVSPLAAARFRRRLTRALRSIDHIHEPRFDEGIQITVEHAIRVTHLDSGPMVLDQAVGL